MLYQRGYLGKDHSVDLRARSGSHSMEVCGWQPTMLELLSRSRSMTYRTKQGLSYEKTVVQVEL